MNKKVKVLVLCLVAVVVAAAVAVTNGLVSFAGNNEGNSVTIYYGGFDKANIHYQVGNGEWTQAPGIAMEASTELDGYKNKAVINLGDADYAKVCFNDGNNNWDNNESKDYTLKAGTYAIYCRQIFNVDNVDTSKLGVAFVAPDREYTNVSGCAGIYSAAVGGKAPYEYKFTSINSNGEESLIRDFSEWNSSSWVACKSGISTLKVEVKDAEGKTAVKTFDNFEVKGLKILSVDTSVASPQQLGSTIRLSTTREYEVSYRYNTHLFTITNNTTGKQQTLSCGFLRYADWTPSEAGNYTIEALVADCMGQSDKLSIDFTIESDHNYNQNQNKSVTIYYNAGNNKTENIHYQIGDGNWTEVPGVAMKETTKVEGYTHVYTVDLGTADTLTACFNDGNGNWDSKLGQNYKFDANKTYYIKDYVTRMEP